MIISFFALACFYFVLTVLGAVRLCQVPGTKDDAHGLLRWFYAILTLTCAMRLTGFVFCTARYAHTGEEFIDGELLEEVI